MHTLEDFTLIVPTHNRPYKFECLANLLSQYSGKTNVIFLDSSNIKTKNKNKQLIQSLFQKNINYSYYEFDSNCDPFEKFYFGILKVTTSYCSMCADDDVVLLESVKEIIEFLESNPDYIAAHGYYFSFQLDETGVEIQDVVYYLNNLSQDEKMRRVNSLFSNYEATFYATYRTESIKHFFSLISTVNTTLWKELILALAAVMSGKIYRTPSFYYGRRVGESLPFNNWHPHEIFSKNPNLYFTDYLRCRTALLDHFCVTQEKEEKLFDLSHLLYLNRYLDSQKLNEYSNEPYQKSQSKEGSFYKEQQMNASLLQKAYKSRKAKSPFRLYLSISLRGLLLSLGYKLVHKFVFLKPIIKKIGVFLVPNITIKNMSKKVLPLPYSFGSEFFLRNLPRGHRPNKKDIEFIVSSMEKYSICNLNK